MRWRAGAPLAAAIRECSLSSAAISATEPEKVPAAASAPKAVTVLCRQNRATLRQLTKGNGANANSNHFRTFHAAPKTFPKTFYSDQGDSPVTSRVTSTSSAVTGPDLLRLRRSKAMLPPRQSEYVDAILLENTRLSAELVAERRERRKAEEALRASEASLDEMQRISQTGSWRWNVRTGV